MAVRHFSMNYDRRTPNTYADTLCRRPMPTTYADDLCRQPMPTGCANRLSQRPYWDNEKIQPPLQMVQKCPPEGMPTTYADTPMPTTYADDLCRHTMPTPYADDLCRQPMPTGLPITSLTLETLNVSRPYYIYNIYICSKYEELP